MMNVSCIVCMFHVTWTTFKFSRNQLGTISAYSKECNIQGPCLFLKSGFLPLVYWFVNLNLTNKHGTKHL